MKFSLAGVGDVFSRLERVVPRRLPRRTMLGYGAYTTGLFLCFLVYTFPAEVIAQRLVNRVAADSGWIVRYDGVRLVPWSGFSFSNLSFAAPQKPGDAAIRFAALAVRPSLRTFVGGGFRRARFSGQAYGGALSGTADWSAVPTVDLSWTELNLAEYSALSALIEGSWVGKLSGEAHFQGKEFPAAIEGSGKLDIKSAGLTRGNVGGFKIPDLHFAQGASEFEVKGGNLEIKTLKLSGPEIDVDLRGQLYLRKPVGQSVLAGTLGVRPVPGGAPEIENALKLMNGNRPPANGTYSYALSGFLSDPRAR